MTKQRGFAVWLTGLPSSGKSTLAQALAQELAQLDVMTQILDSDELRGRITPKPTYSAEERDWFYGIVIWLVEILTQNGVNVLIAATASRRHYRELARGRVARFAEVHLICPPETCRARDPKRLWQQADAGLINHLPGINEPYEPPDCPEVRVDTSSLSISEATQHILDTLQQQNFWLEQP